MVFKLVRIDSVSSKIEVSEGVHAIGRGKLLHCDDKRISRNHGELEVNGEFLTIKALHQNPLFFKKKGASEQIILNKDSKEVLCHGDRFGLLPDTHWYEIINCQSNGEPNEEEERIDEGENRINEAAEDKESTNYDTDTMEDVLPNEPDIHSQETVIAAAESNEDNQPDNLDMNETQTNDTSNSQLLLTHNNETSPAEAVKAEPESPLKRSHSPDTSELDTKKIKTEPEDAQPGPSAKADSNNKDNQASPQKAPLRERCMYGASCYRKNPQHKSDFSHPTDPDWGAGERGLCPYGGRCAKRDPRHWRDHDHPPGARPPAPAPAPRPGKKRRRSSSPANLVQGKRTRKVVQQQNYSGSDGSQSEPDPFGSDESDEWTPGDMTSQDYSEDFV